MNPLAFPPALRFSLPQQRCCNCGSIVGKQILDLEAPVPGNGLPDGARRFLLLPVPVCAAPGCVQSLRRQPWPWSALVAAGALVGLLGFLIWMRLHPGHAIREIGGLSALLGALVGGALLGFAARWLRRPQAPQSSAFAPIRIRHLYAPQDQVASLHLDFTHADYARDFQLTNAERLSAGKLVARHISGR